jgi:hypothetical protein
MTEYLVVSFPQRRRVLLNDAPRGYTNERLDLEGGTYTVSLLQPPLDFTPTEQVIDLRNTAPMNPREVKFEEI